MIDNFIYGLHPIVLIILVLGSSVAVALGCVFISRYIRKIKNINDPDDAEFKIETYSDAFGVAYAILISLIITATWTVYKETDHLWKKEVSFLNNLYDLSGDLNDLDKQRIRQNLRKYVDIVVKTEWPLLTQGKYSKIADSYLFDNFNIVYSIKQHNEKEVLIRTQLNEIVKNVNQVREARILDAASSLPDIMWIIIISFTIITLLVLSLATQGSLFLHAILQFLYALGAGLLLLLLIILDRPFYYGFYYAGGIALDHFNELMQDWDKKEGKVSLQKNSNIG